MLTMTTLGKILKTVFNGMDDNIIPLQGNWFVPLKRGKDSVQTWIGYVILSKYPRVRTWQGDRDLYKDTKTVFRVTFTGPQAEEMAYSTLVWDERLDVRKLFEEIGCQLCYDERRIYTRVFEQEGFNNTITWAIDFAALDYYIYDTEQTPWIPIY